MTRLKALLAGSTIAAATALSAMAVTAAPTGNGPASADTTARPAHHGVHKARGEGGRHHGGWRRGGSCGKHAGGMARHVDLIEGLMDFTPTQQTAWDDLKSAMEAGKKTIDTSCEARKEDGKPKTAIERFNRFEDAMSTRLAVMRSVKPAFEKFYGTLNEKQQKAVDSLLTRKGRRG